MEHEETKIGKSRRISGPDADMENIGVIVRELRLMLTNDNLLASKHIKGDS
jgi:hypothetical protein